jgi:hypothetical protein
MSFQAILERKKERVPAVTRAAVAYGMTEVCKRRKPDEPAFAAGFVRLTAEPHWQSGQQKRRASMRKVSLMLVMTAAIVAHQEGHSAHKTRDAWYY